MPDEREVIAERLFYLEDAPRTERTPAVVFRLFRPTQEPGNYPIARYQLVVQGQVQEDRKVSGVDELDCLVMALSVAGTTLKGLNESVFGGKLRWPDGSDNGRALGLPTIEDSWPTNHMYQEALRWSMNQQSEDKA